MIYCTCGHFLHKETGVNRKFVKYTMDLLPVPEYVIKKRRAHEHRYGKKQRDKEYYLANQLKKKCKKRQFLGIHDRFLRDQEFCIRMIEHHRDEEVLSTMGCSRRWRSHSPFDRTRILSLQKQMVAPPKQARTQYHAMETSFWFQASVVYLATITTRSRRRTTRAYLLLQAQTMAVGTEFILYVVELARFVVDSLSFRKSRRRCAKYWVNGVTRYYKYLAKTFEDGFHKFNLFCYRWIVYSWRRSIVTNGRCKENTSNDPFSRCKSVQ